jgi:hypothetical protein
MRGQAYAPGNPCELWEPLEVTFQAMCGTPRSAADPSPPHPPPLDPQAGAIAKTVRGPSTQQPPTS